MKTPKPHLVSTEQLIDNLTRAREVFREQGGAKYTYQDENGKVCALGALGIVLGADIRTEEANYVLCTKEAELLHRASLDLHGVSSVAVVNDRKSPSAILSVYDHSIKELENQ